MDQQSPVQSSAEAVRHFAALNWDGGDECLAVLALDQKNAPLRSEVVAMGSEYTVAAKIRQIARFALDNDASALVIAHNHGSGDPTPSEDDIATTRYIALWLRPLGVELLDHLILGSDRYVSLRDIGVV